VGALSCIFIAQTPLAQSFTSEDYPFRYKTAFAFSVILYPQGLRRGLLPSYFAGYLPTARKDRFGLTAFLQQYRIGLASFSTPGEFSVLTVASG
jgi:hypothetical protein